MLKFNRYDSPLAPLPSLPIPYKNKVCLGGKRMLGRSFISGGGI